MRNVYCILMLSVFCVLGAFGDSVSRTSQLYERGSSAVDEGAMLKVHFIDVGGGDGILIDTPSDKKILIDAGWSWADRGKAAKEYQAYINKFLEDDVVDLVVITHPDYDHFAGIEAILKSRVVRQIWYSGYDSSDLSGSWRTLCDAIANKAGVLFISPVADYFGPGSTIRFDDADTYTLSDDIVLTLVNAKQWLSETAYDSQRAMDEAQRRNSSSLVIRLDYGNTSFLFTGDTNGREKESPVETCDDQELFMVRNNDNPENPLYGKLGCTVLKVAHHGSDGSSSLGFLTAAHPTWAVISAGVHHGHPHPAVLERLKRIEVGLDEAHILRTDADDAADGPATEANLGDDCYQFYVDPDGIVKIEKWNVRVN